MRTGELCSEGQRTNGGRLSAREFGEERGVLVVFIPGPSCVGAQSIAE